MNTLRKLIGLMTAMMLAAFAGSGIGSPSETFYAVSTRRSHRRREFNDDVLQHFAESLDDQLDRDRAARFGR